MKHYNIKLTSKKKDILQSGAKEGGDILFIDKYIPFKHSEIRVRISIPKDIRSWNEKDNVTIMDTDAGIPFRPFYKLMYDENAPMSENMKDFMRDYHEFMDGMPFLKIKK